LLLQVSGALAFSPVKIIVEETFFESKKMRRENHFYPDPYSGNRGVSKVAESKNPPCADAEALAQAFGGQGGISS